MRIQYEFGEVDKVICHVISRPHAAVSLKGRPDFGAEFDYYQLSLVLTAGNIIELQAHYTVESD